MTLRAFLLCFLAVAVPAALSGCGIVRGDKDVDTADGEGAIGKGPGLITGKRGAVIIYQR